LDAKHERERRADKARDEGRDSGITGKPGILFPSEREYLITQINQKLGLGIAMSLQWFLEQVFVSFLSTISQWLIMLSEFEVFDLKSHHLLYARVLGGEKISSIFIPSFL
jgi:hypothetical protein